MNQADTTVSSDISSGSTTLAESRNNVTGASTSSETDTSTDSTNSTELSRRL